MSHLFKRLTLIFIIVGSAILAVNYLYGGDSTTLLTMERIPNTNLFWYKIDTLKYFQNLNATFQSAIYLELDKPPQSWIPNATLEQFIQNNMLLILNWVVFILNMIIMPFKVVFYVLKCLLAFLGVDTTANAQGGMTWLVRLADFIINFIQIPYATA